jgi:hypothetical protein
MKSDGPLRFTRVLVAANNIGQRIDWSKAAEATSRNEGVAQEEKVSAIVQ